MKRQGPTEKTYTRLLCDGCDYLELNGGKGNIKSSNFCIHPSLKKKVWLDWYGVDWETPCPDRWCPVLNKKEK